jgi:hypothetical protein
MEIESPDEEIFRLFDGARIKLDKIEGNSKQQKKQVIKDLAKRLEDKIQADTICIEITNQLRGQVSDSFVRQCLDDKYKQSHRVENAKKQNKKQNPFGEYKENVEDLASLPTLNQEGQTDKIIMVEVNGQPVDHKDWDDTSVLNDADPFGENKVIEKESSQNVQLKESIRKPSPLTASDNTKNIHGYKNKSEIAVINFEFFKTYREVSNYAKPFFYKGNNSEIWFHGKIDITTGKVISSDFGRTNEQLEGAGV